MASEKKTYELEVQPRDLVGKHSQKLRRQGIIPAVVYGHKVDPVSVSVDSKEMERVYLRAGSNSLVDLKLGTGEPRKVFIHNVQRDPVTHNLRHIDFMVVNLREEITTTVPIVLTGESPIVKNGDGLLIQQLDHIQVRALPANIPNTLEADISGLDEIDKAVHVSDLTIPDGVHVLTGEDELIAKASALPIIPVEEEEAEEAAEAEAEEGEAAEGDADADTESESEDNS